MIPLDAFRQPTTASPILRWFAKEADAVIVARIDPDAETATIKTPEGTTTIAFSGRVGDKPVFQITNPAGRISTALNFREAVEFCVGRAIRSAAAIAKIRKAS